MDDINKKKEQLMRVLGEYLNEQDDNPENPLFHYTGFKGLSGILESRELWYTNHKYLNDPSEISHGKNLIVNFIKSRIQDSALQFILCDTISRIEKNCNAYMVSFCENGDYLPAWRYYGDNGAGFSIGFRKQYFNRSENPTHLDIINFFKVEYRSDKYQHIEHMFDKASEIYPNWEKQFTKEDIPYYDALISNLITILPRVKNEDYQHEIEWRLVLMKIYNEQMKLWIPTEIPMDRFFIDPIKLSTIPPFIRDLKTSVPRIRTLKFGFCDIDSIFIGPRLDFLAAKLSIEKMLIDFGASESERCGIKIVKSMRAYR